MIQKFKKFTKLSVEEKKLFFEAYVLLGMMRSAILTISFKRLTHSLEQYDNIWDLSIYYNNYIEKMQGIDHTIPMNNY